MTTDAGTPRTDAAELVESETRWGVAPKRWPYVPADFARTLERSLTAAEAERDALRARVAGLEAALKPFANFACDEPCQCNNCIARALLAPSSEPQP